MSLVPAFYAISTRLRPLALAAYSAWSAIIVVNSFNLESQVQQNITNLQQLEQLTLSCLSSNMALVQL